MLTQDEGMGMVSDGNKRSGWKNLSRNGVLY